MPVFCMAVLLAGSLNPSKSNTSVHPGWTDCSQLTGQALDSWVDTRNLDGGATSLIHAVSILGDVPSGLPAG